jgi:hypothetical protein
MLPHRRELLADGRPVKLGGRAPDVLITLLEGPGRVVSRDELILRVWPNRVVEEKAARRAVAPAIGYMVEAVLALFLVTVVQGRRELRARGDVLGMAVRQIHPHLHVLDLRRFERIEVGVIYPDLPGLTRLNSPPIDADGYPIH